MEINNKFDPINFGEAEDFDLSVIFNEIRRCVLREKVAKGYSEQTYHLIMYWISHIFGL